MYQAVSEVYPGENYTLKVVFKNGDSGVLDIAPMLDFGIFRMLKDKESFKRVRVSFDTIEWDCGIDLDPEFIYAKCMAR